MDVWVQADANGRCLVKNIKGGRQHFGYRKLGILISAIAGRCIPFSFVDKRALQVVRLPKQALMLA